MWRAVAVLCGLLTIGMSRPGWAQDAAICSDDDDVTPEARLAACGRLIEAGRLSPPRLATAHFFRGYGWSQSGEHARAIADLTEALALDPKIEEAWRLRGLSEFYLRQYRLAAIDFEQLVKLEPREAYTPIWRYLADVRVVGAWDAYWNLKESWEKWDTTEWPGPVALFLLGKLGVDDVRRAARRGDAETRAGQACEADYYLGQWHLIHGRRDDARALFQHAAATCPKEFYEYLGAVAALKPLDAPAAPLDAATAADRRACMNAEATPAERLAACSRAIAVGQADLYQARALSAVALGSWDRAFADLGEAIRRDPKNPRLYRDRGDAWHAKGETYKAMPDYNAALHLAFDGEVYGKRGREWLGRGIYTTAIGDFTEAIRLDGRNPEHYENRALAWDKKGEAEKARADRDKAARLRAGAAQRRQG